MGKILVNQENSVLRETKLKNLFFDCDRFLALFLSLDLHESPLFQLQIHDQIWP